MLGDTLIANTYPESWPLRDPRLEHELLHVAKYKGICEVHGCMAAADVMAKELDHALATRTQHEPGALVACSPNDAPSQVRR